MAGNATYVNAHRAYYSADRITDSNVSGASKLGTRAPGTAVGAIDVGTAEALASKRAVSAAQDLVWIGYGDAVDAVVKAAADLADPTDGYLYLANASNTRLDEFRVQVVSAYVMPVDDEAQRARVVYSFYAYGDTPEDVHTVYDAAVTTEAA